MYFAFALPMITAYTGAILTFLMTGEPPDELLDLFTPETSFKGKNGKNLRTVIPSYTRDFMALGTALYNKNPSMLAEMLKHKMSPVANVGKEVWTGRDYRNQEIVRHTGTQAEKMTDRGLFVIRHLSPFSYTTGKRMYNKTKSMKATTIFTALGLTPQPRNQTQTIMENDIDHFVSLIFSGTKTKEQAEKIQLLGEISSDFEITGKWDQAKLIKAKKAGYIKNTTKFKLSRQKYSATVRKFGMLTDDIQEYLFKKMSKSEQTKYMVKLKLKARKDLRRLGYSVPLKTKGGR